VPGIFSEGQQVPLSLVAVLERDLGQHADDRVDHRRAQPAIQRGSASGGSDGGNRGAVEVVAGREGSGSFDHGLGGSWGDISKVLEQPRDRPVSEQFHDTARLDFDEQRTDPSFKGPHGSEQRGDAVGIRTNVHNTKG
jgi:hypothetical protein